MWRYLLRPILFRMDAEWVHYFAMNSFTIGLAFPLAKPILSGLATVRDSRLNVNLLGLEFDNPVGLAAGFDKDARWYNQLSALGFSHIEVGTLTGQPQDGNPKKRLFRFAQDQALLNCMGFNNRGSEAARESMAAAHKGGQKNGSILGINIGLSKTVAVEISEEADQKKIQRGGKPLADEEKMKLAQDDYLLSFRRMYDFADYFTLNVSSPNTKGLRDLQHPRKIGELISAIRKANLELSVDESKSKPVLVKLAPDLSDQELDETLEALLEQKVDGLIATNTTISDENITAPKEVVQSKRCQCPNPGGGFSGKPLTEVSRQFVSKVFAKTEGKLPIVGVGGIMSGEDAWKMLEAGASIVQVYTGFIYGGPFFVKQMNRYLLQRMEKEGVKSINEIVGTAHSS